MTVILINLENADFYSFGCYTTGVSVVTEYFRKFIANT